MKDTLKSEETLIRERQAFIEREQKILAAYHRAHALLAKYRPELPNWDKLHSWDFNLLHDLEDRMLARIADFRSEFYDWHWDAYGWNAY